MIGTLLATIASAPATRPIRGLDDVQSNYQDETAAAKREYQEMIEKADEERLQGLHTLEDRALQNQDIDLASNIRGNIKAIEHSSQEAPAMSESDRQNQMNWLEHRLDGTLWHWGDDFVRFEPDGNVGNYGWTSRGLVTHWRVIDTRTVLFTIVRGRGDNLYAILTFSPNAAFYNGQGFEGGKPLTRGTPQIGPPISGQ
jgi:hypothetical protein